MGRGNHLCRKKKPPSVPSACGVTWHVSGSGPSLCEEVQLASLMTRGWGRGGCPPLAHPAHGTPRSHTRSHVATVQVLYFSYNSATPELQQHRKNVKNTKPRFPGPTRPCTCRQARLRLPGFRGGLLPMPPQPPPPTHSAPRSHECERQSLWLDLSSRAVAGAGGPSPGLTHTGQTDGRTKTRAGRAGRLDSLLQLPQLSSEGLPAVALGLETSSGLGWGWRGSG